MRILFLVLIAVLSYAQAHAVDPQSGNIGVDNTRHYDGGGTKLNLNDPTSVCEVLYSGKNLNPTRSDVLGAYVERAHGYCVNITDASKGMDQNSRAAVANNLFATLQSSIDRRGSVDLSNLIEQLSSYLESLKSQSKK